MAEFTGRFSPDYVYYPNLQNHRTWQIQTILSQSFSSQWTDLSRISNVYNAQGLLAFLSVESVSDGAWVMDRTDTYTYNAQGQVTILTQVFYQPDDSTCTQNLYTYEEGLNTIILIQTLSSGGWRNESRLSLDYDENGNLISRLDDMWLGSSWSHAYLDTYQFNENNLETSSLSQSWVNNQWINQTKMERTYQGSDISTITYFQWSNQAWLPIMKYAYSYQIPALCSQVDISSWDGIQWVCESHGNYFYDSNNNLSSVLVQSLQNRVWVDNYRQI
jgi:hypothetical protein